MPARIWPSEPEPSLLNTLPAALTDTDGDFGLPAPVAGDYTLECSAEVRGAVRVTVSVGRGQPVAADIALMSQ